MNPRNIMSNRTLSYLFPICLSLAACEVETVEAPPQQVEEEVVYSFVPVEEVPESLCGAYLPDGITEADIVEWYEQMVALAGKEVADAQLCGLLQVGIPEAIEHSAENIPPPDPLARWAWIKLRAHAKLPIPVEVITGLGCGETALGTILCGPMDPPTSESEFIIVSMILDDVVPSAGDEIAQYAFVFDENGDTTDNYVAAPQYPNDFWQGTDRWYFLDVTSEGLFLGHLTAANNNIGPIPTAARVILNGSAVTLVIPSSEFSAECPSLRVTAFTHNGDYGLQAPFYWAGDTEPTVFEGLDPVCGN